MASLVLRLIRFVIAGAALVPFVHASAQEYPSRNVTLVVPFAPGGGTDSIARDLARDLSDRLGRPVVVDNRSGDGGAIAAAAIAKSPPDGHTLLFVTSTFVTHAASDTSLRYDILRDFSPVAMIGRGPLLVVTTRDLPVRNVPQLIELGRKQPGSLNYCSAGPGSINHLAGDMFSQRAGVSMTHVPYRGSAPAVIDLLAGRTQVFFATVPTILPYVKDGRVNAIAVTGKARSPLFPELATVAEAGIAFDVGTWWGVVAPAGTPAAIVHRLNTMITDAAAAPKIRGRLVSEGAEPVRGSAADFGTTLAGELDAWRGVVKTSGIKLH